MSRSGASDIDWAFVSYRDIDGARAFVPVNEPSVASGHSRQESIASDLTASDESASQSAAMGGLIMPRLAVDVSESSYAGSFASSPRLDPADAAAVAATDPWAAVSAAPSPSGALAPVPGGPPGPKPRFLVLGSSLHARQAFTNVLVRAIVDDDAAFDPDVITVSPLHHAPPTQAQSTQTQPSTDDAPSELHIACIGSTPSADFFTGIWDDTTAPIDSLCDGLGAVHEEVYSYLNPSMAPSKDMASFVTRGWPNHSFFAFDAALMLFSSPPTLTQVALAARVSSYVPTFISLLLPPIPHQSREQHTHALMAAVKSQMAAAHVLFTPLSALLRSDSGLKRCDGTPAVPPSAGAGDSDALLTKAHDRKSLSSWSCASTDGSDQQDVVHNNDAVPAAAAAAAASVRRPLSAVDRALRIARRPFSVDPNQCFMAVPHHLLMLQDSDAYAVHCSRINQFARLVQSGAACAALRHIRTQIFFQWRDVELCARGHGIPPTRSLLSNAFLKRGLSRYEIDFSKLVSERRMQLKNPPSVPDVGTVLVANPLAHLALSGQDYVHGTATESAAPDTLREPQVEPQVEPHGESREYPHAKAPQPQPQTHKFIASARRSRAHKMDAPSSGSSRTPSTLQDPLNATWFAGERCADSFMGFASASMPAYASSRMSASWSSIASTDSHACASNDPFDFSTLRNVLLIKLNSFIVTSVRMFSSSPVKTGAFPWIGLAMLAGWLCSERFI